MKVLLCSSTMAGLAGGGVHRNDPQHLMPALVVQECEPAGIRRPAHVRRCSRGWEKANRLMGISLLAATSNKCGLEMGTRSPGLRYS